MQVSSPSNDEPAVLGASDAGEVTPARSDANTSDDSSTVEDFGFTVATVARRLGVAPATLRTWARRYGLGASLHTTGAHRRYTPADVERLDQVQRLVTRGVPLASAAAAVLRGSVDLPEPGQVSDTPKGPSGGGVVIALPQADAPTRGLARAATALDSGECARIMSGSIARRGVIATWDDVVRPVLQSIGSKWQRTDQGVEVEHALSHSVIAVFAHAGEMLTKPVNSRPIILACTTDEQHSLPLYAMYAALAERNISARVLGARVPADSLAHAIERTGPAAVIVWSQLTETADVAYLESLPKTRPPVTVIAAGPGWNESGTGSFAQVGDLNETVMRVQEALRLG